jgi:hypothetical protein
MGVNLRIFELNLCYSLIKYNQVTPNHLLDYIIKSLSMFKSDETKVVLLAC